MFKIVICRVEREARDEESRESMEADRAQLLELAPVFVLRLNEADKRNIIRILPELKEVIYPEQKEAEVAVA